jgi:hypothetical protein
MKVAELLNVSLDFGKSSSNRLIFWNPHIKEALEPIVGVSHCLPRVALFKGVPYLLGRVLAFDELGNI